MDRGFKLSNYQEAILNELKNGRGNMLVDAKAGSGKTSTLLIIADEIIKQNKKCLFLAFNKSIVDELQSRIMNENVQIKTLHSLGLSFIRSYLYRKHKEDYELIIYQHDENIKEEVKLLFNEICLESFKISPNVMDLDETEVKSTYDDLIREIVSMVNYVRLYNINSKDYDRVLELGRELCWNLKEYYDYGVYDYPQIIEQVIIKIRNDFENPEILQDGKPLYKIGYTDMIYFPCYYKMYPPFGVKAYLDYILCDECQDLSVLQQFFLKLLNTGFNRYIFVGDEKQAIYGFAGADTQSINNLRRNFMLKELPLNICYRCPENVIKISQQIVPSIDWNHNREDKGIVEFTQEENLSKEVQPGDIILGRRNKDLLRIYKEFVFKYKKPIKFKNKDMVSTVINEIKRVIKEYIKRYNQFLNVEKQLYEILIKQDIDISQPANDLSKKQLKLMDTTYNELIRQNKLKNAKKGVKKQKCTINYLNKCMDEFKEEGDYKYSIDDSLNAIYTDYFDIIYYFVENYLDNYGDDLVDEFIKHLQKYFEGSLSENAPILSSIHMMKGGEANNVFILDYPRFPYIYNTQPEDIKQQEINLQYVALTRPKKNLYLCEISKLRPRETEEDIMEKNMECIRKVKNIIN